MPPLRVKGLMNGGLIVWHMALRELGMNLMLDNTICVPTVLYWIMLYLMSLWASIFEYISFVPMFVFLFRSRFFCNSNVRVFGARLKPFRFRAKSSRCCMRHFYENLTQYNLFTHFFQLKLLLCQLIDGVPTCSD